MKLVLVACALVAFALADDGCTSYLDCDGYGKGEFVMCVNGQCKPNVPCNKDDDCAFYGMADMEYSIMERGPVIAMCMKVDPAPKPGYGYCQLKPAIMVNDDNMWPQRIAGDNVKRALRRQ